MVQWVNRSLIQAPRNGTTSHTVSFTPAASGNLLVAIVEGAVTSTTPTGWTLPANGSAVNNTGLYVWYKTATASEASFTTTHNGANYPVAFVIYEFAAGSTFVKSATANNLATTAANPALTGLTGTNLTFGAIGVDDTANNAYTSTAWSGVGSPVEDVDLAVADSGTDGYGVSVAYVESNTATSFQPTGAATQTGTAVAKEALTFAVNVVAPSGSSYSGSVALTGAGSLVGTGKPATSGSTARSGAGALALGGTPATSGTVATNGTGTLSLSGVANAAGSLAFGGTGSLTFSAGTGYTGALALSGTGSLAFAGTPKPAGTLTLGGNGSLTLTGNGSGAGTGTLALTSTGTLTLSGTVTASGALTLAGLGTLTATGQPRTGGTLGLSGMGVLSLSGVPLGLPVDITVTGSLDPRRWAVTLPDRSKTATLEPRRWAGSL
jgi:hypothetical protein